VTPQTKAERQHIRQALGRYYFRDQCAAVVELATWAGVEITVTRLHLGNPFDPNGKFGQIEDVTNQYIKQKESK
jgi:hypothetical protein